MIFGSLIQTLSMIAYGRTIPQFSLACIGFTAMGNQKDKSAKGNVNKHIFARVSYLHQAATYLSQQQHVLLRQEHLKDEECGQSIDKFKQGAGRKLEQQGTDRASLGTSDESSVKSSLREQRRLVSHLRAVSLKGKGQARLPAELKQSICKRCDTLLVEPSTCRAYTENKSRGGRKPWAEVKVLECVCCGAKKRFPVGSERQARKVLRKTKEDLDASKLGDNENLG